MQSSQAIQWLLMAVLLPAFAVTLALGIRDGLANGHWHYRIVVTSAAGDASFPVLERIHDRSLAGELEEGDRLLRVGGFDLRGVTSRGTIARASRAASGGPVASVLAERGDRRFETWIERSPKPFWWSGIPFALAAIAVPTLVFLKAPQRSGTRSLFVASCAAGIVFASDFGRIVPESYLVVIVYNASVTVMYAGIVSFALRWTQSAAVSPAWRWALPVLAGGAALLGQLAYYWLPSLVPGLPNASLLFLGQAVALLVLLGAFTRSYRRADALERRQTRWALYGLVVGAFPTLALYLAQAVAVVPGWLEHIYPIAAIAIPIGFGIAILGYGWLDVDRLISATASLAVLGVAVLGAALALVPRLAEGLSRTLGVDAALGQWALSLAVVAAAIPVHRSLRPWLDRRIFADQAERMAGFERLLVELGTCGSAAELTALTGERLEALLAPDSLALYAQDGDLFTPIFVHGQGAPAAFQADSMLVRALEARTTPMAASDDALDAFDRAALTTLGAELVIPVRRSETLAAFACLGRKHSGDIYTASDRAVLAAVAHKIGDRLAQLDAEELSRDTHAMQERLRRYVPGAVAEELAAGRDLEPEERQVSVLFVDLRGYTSFAEGRAAHAVFSTINEHTERVSRLVQRHGGTVVEFNGDGMMAVFGAPEALENKERAAVQTARDVVEGMPDDLRVGVGIATGEAMVGSIRSADRWIWSAIGNTTNLAARLQTLTRELDAAIAVDAPTWRAAGYVCGDFERHEGVAIRGRRGRFDVYALPA